MHSIEDKINKTIEDFLSEITLYERIKFRLRFELGELWYKITTEKFRLRLRLTKYLLLMRLSGYNPLIIGEFVGEYVFVFHTERESDKAFKFFEQRLGLIVGWWYGFNDYTKEVDELKKEEWRNKVYWHKNFGLII